MTGVGCGAASAPTAAEDEAKATSIVLRASDVPGFTADEDDADGDDGGFRACLKDNPTWSVRPNPRGADSSFTNDEDVVVSSGALLTVKEPEARKAFADVKAASTSQCMKDELKASILEDAPRGLTVGDVAVAPFPSPGLGDESVASRLTVEIAAGAERQKLYLDLTFVRQGRIVSGLMISRSGTPFPDGERARLSTILAERMEGRAGEVAPFPSVSTPTTSMAAPTTAGKSPTTTAGSPSTTGVSATGWTQHRDASGVTFSHPPSWKVDRMGEIITVLIDPVGVGPFRRNVNIMLQRRSQPVTLEEYTEAGVREYREDKAITLGQVHSTTLSGTPGRRLTYRTTDDGGRQALQVWTVRSDGVWLVTYMSDAGAGRFGDALADVERMLASLKLPA